MSDKEVAFDTLRGMSEAATLDEISEEIAIMAAIRRGEDAGDAGKYIPHEDVRGVMASWISK